MYGADGNSTVADDSAKNEESTSGMGGGVVALIEIAINNYEQLKKETETDDQKAAQDYTELKNSKQVQSKKLDADLQWRKRLQTKVSGEKMRSESDLTAYKKQVSALQTMKGTLEKSCTAKVDSYDERKAR